MVLDLYQEVVQGNHSVSLRKNFRYKYYHKISL